MHAQPQLEEPPVPSVIDGRRRSRRLATTLRFRIVGLQPQMATCTGDLAATGVYMSSAIVSGAPGDVVLLELASADERGRVQTLARVARVVRQDNATRGAQVIGTAFEFLPVDVVSPEVGALLQAATRYELGQLGALRIDDPVWCRLDSAASSPQRVRVLRLGSHQVVVHSERSLPEDCEATFREPESDSSTPCRVVSSTSLPEGDYQIVLRSTEMAPATSLTTLACQLILPEKLTPRAATTRDFGGELNRVQSSEILSFLSDAGYSGVFSVADEVALFSAELVDGKVVSCETNSESHGDDALSTMLELADGQFKFRCHRSLLKEGAHELGTNRLMQDLFSAQASE